jgi:hypothetical protein
MKQYLLVSLLVLVSSIVNAQQPGGVSTVKNEPSPIQKSRGVKIGLNFSNLSDIYLKAQNTIRKSSPKLNATADGRTGESMQVLGLSLGHKDNYYFGDYGYDTSATIYKALNTKSADAKLTIIKSEGDLVYPYTNAISFLAGLNISYAAGFETSDYGTRPSAGFQLGMQYETNGIGILLAYQSLGFNINGSYTNPSSGFRAETDETIMTSGLTTQLSYTF